MHSGVGEIVVDGEGNPVLNEAVRVQALRELRLNSESRRRLTGADLTAAAPGNGEARAAMEANLAKITAARQAELADLARRETELAARERAIMAALTPQHGDSSITDAELVDDDPEP